MRPCMSNADRIDPFQAFRDVTLLDFIVSHDINEFDDEITPVFSGPEL